MPETLDFLSLVVPWPENGPGYVNLHWTTPDKKNPKKSYFNGTPFKSPRELISRATWLKDKPDVRDIYFCTSLQSAATTSRSGKAKAIRDQRNVLGLRSLFYDLDAKGYPSKVAALLAFKDFLAISGLPFPSAIVDSGGGFHIYWALKQTLSREEWQPFADGMSHLAEQFKLKIDGGVTTDSARVLRVPDTYNCKQKEKRSVVLIHVGSPYDLSVFEPIKAVPKPVKNLPATLCYDPEEFKDITPVVRLDGVPRIPLSTENRPLDPEPIFAGCGFLREARDTGGKDYAQPAWNLTTLCTTWMADGHALCHRLSDKHPEYSQEATDELWNRKIKEREEKSIGWPSCSAISTQTASAHCQKCPHFAKNSTPLHLAIQSRAERTAHVGGESDNPLNLPPAYYLGADGTIWREGTGKRGEDAVHQVLECKIGDPFVTAAPRALNFTTALDKGHTGRVCLPQNQMRAGKIEDALLSAGVVYVSDSKKFLEGLFLSWLRRLREQAEASRASSFGWYMPDNVNPEGFSYGGKLLLPGGEERVAGYPDQATADTYHPTGEIEPWFAACKLITNQNSPGLEIGVIASFASVLLKSAGKAASCLFIVGESGCGKSSACRVGLAVWGHPDKTKETATTTAKSAVEKSGTVKALPVYQDDIQKPVDQDKFIDQMFMKSEGIDGGRLNSDLTQRDRKTWNNLTIATGNRSMAERVMFRQPDHDAGLKRIFEYRVEEATEGQMSDYDATQILDKLTGNFGHMGLRYARFLVENLESVGKLTEYWIKWFEKELDVHKSERYWTTLCGTLMAAGLIANQLGCEFHLEDIKAFLVQEYKNQRSRITNEGTSNDPISLLTEFVQDNEAKQMWTNAGQRTHFDGEARRGRPDATAVVFGPPRPGDPVLIQWDQEHRQMKFYRPQFYSWLVKKNLSPSVVYGQLKKIFKVDLERACLSKGTAYEQGRGVAIVITIGPNTKHELYAQLFRRKDNNSPDDYGKEGGAEAA